VIIDIQFNQGSASWPALREGVLAAEEAGFSAVWNLDHFSGAMFNSDSMMECFTSLTAWATVTSRINVGTLVTNINNRHPGLLANIVSTVQDISNGRLLLGVGAGTSPNSPYGAEQRALNMDVLTPMSARHERLLENIAVMRNIWAHDRDDSFVGFPRPLQEPPIIVGVNSLGLAALAGQHFDGVNTRFNHPQRAELIAAAKKAHSGDSFDVSVWSPFVPEYADPEHPFHKELVADGVTRLIMFDHGAPHLETIEKTRRYLA
jgi:alkanesulfonate monooxygenase SsuD/methylene tetrahydromethanopterin reductase-like flavin-dependent oxidoreductase (luciferase family)